MKKVFWETLPKKTYNNIEFVDWDKSVGMKVHFIYNNIEDDLDIIERIDCEHIVVKYNNRSVVIHTNVFKKSGLGNLLKTKSRDFKYKIGERILDKKRNLIITDRKRDNNKGYKYYKYKCLVCGFDCGENYNVRCNKLRNEFWIKENSLLSDDIGCSCCSNQIVVRGINDIATTSHELLPCFVNIEDAYNYVIGSSQKILAKCPNCGYIRNIRINALKKLVGGSCPKCGDGFSYPEKFMLNVLEQLQINPITQFGRTSKSWCGSYKYDFYFEYNNEHYIIETHGEQHYRESTNLKRTLKQEQENDRLKKELALLNGINHYIVIDCRKSELEWIKDNILKSELKYVFDLNTIKWDKCNEESHKNLVKEICDCWNNKAYNESMMDLAKIYPYINKATIRAYLKKGSNLGWCSYNPKEEQRKSAIRNSKSKE